MQLLFSCGMEGEGNLGQHQLNVCKGGLLPAGRPLFYSAPYGVTSLTQRTEYP